MRLAPLLTAIAVLVSLYLLIMERPMLLALAGAGQSEAAAPLEEAPPAPEERRVSVVVERFEERELESAVVLRGRTEAARQVEVRAETTGLVVSEPLPRGSSVRAGDVMCELDPGTRRAALAEAEARLAEAQINYTTATRLSEDGFAAQTRVAAAEAARRGAEAAVEAAQTELARLQIRAPFDGLIEDDTAERGSLLSPGGLCGRVLRLDPMLLVAFAAEAQIDQLEPGAVAGARLASGAEVTGRVTFLARSADPATRTFRVEVTVPNPDLVLRDGMSADLLVAARSSRGHLVPGSALTLDDGGRLGLRLVDGDARTFFAPVRVLRDSTEGFWVAGLPEVVDVVVVGHEYVTDGVTVNAVRRAAGD
jgi:membrane fusion protein, multidrug efflux system